MLKPEPDRHFAAGTIIVMKPNHASGLSADVLQQSTGDQWFDEAQFESYRRLGSISADSLFAGGEVRDFETFVAELKARM